MVDDVLALLSGDDIAVWRLGKPNISCIFAYCGNAELIAPESYNSIQVRHLAV